MNKKLPPLFYYTLDQAAIELECSSDYLIHLGETGRLEIIARVNRAICDVEIVSADWHMEYQEPCPAFIGISAVDLEEWRGCIGSFRFCSPVSGYNIGVNGLNPVFVQGTIQATERLAKGDEYFSESTINIVDNLIEKSTGESPKDFITAVKKKNIYDWIEIQRSDLYLSANEVARLKQGGEMSVSLANSLQVRPDSPTNKKNEHLVSKMVGILSLLLAEKTGRYKRGNAPNAKQIAIDSVDLLKEIPDSTTYGLGETNLRTAIANGVKALNGIT
jgi:hypothetical protein